MRDEIAALVSKRSGHFVFESGHHGSIWLDLETLCLRPGRIEPLAARIAAALAGHNIEVVCGPLVEGAFVALMVARHLGVPFTYAQRFEGAAGAGLYSVAYRLPRSLRAHVRGKRVAIVNDVINAGSAVGGAFADLQRCGAIPVAIGALLVLGEWASRFAAEKQLALEVLSVVPNELWTPSECPLCQKGMPLVDPIETGE